MCGAALRSVLKAVARHMSLRLDCRDPNIQMLALLALESCFAAGSPVFQEAVASKQVLKQVVEIALDPEARFCVGL